jgi:hypothetical protein
MKINKSDKGELIELYKIKLLNNISDVIYTHLSPDSYQITDSIDESHGILVRSANMHDIDLPSNLLGIARAGAGVNNIPLEKCTEQGIVVFNTPGANANAVKELVLCVLFLTSRNIIQGIEWVKSLKGKGDEIPKLIEKGKSSFTGPEIAGKKLGVEGMSKEIILNALQRAGCTFFKAHAESEDKRHNRRPITKLDLFKDGLSGGRNSSLLRAYLKNELNLPSRLTVNGLLEVLNALFTYEEYREYMKGFQLRYQKPDKSDY